MMLAGQLQSEEGKWVTKAPDKQDIAKVIVTLLANNVQLFLLRSRYPGE